MTEKRQPPTKFPKRVYTQKEVLEAKGQRVYPDDTEARNLAFDVTPAENITAFVNELGVFKNMEELQEKWKRMKE